MSLEFYYNTRALQTLTAFINGGRFPHAILLEGEHGSGRRTFAGIMAAALFCTATEPDPRPCMSCVACQKVLRGIHPDVIRCGGDGTARSFHIDTIRSLRREAYILPNEAPCKVFILSRAEDMTVQAQNSLLKILEEPPEHAVFILTCESRLALLPTILSRVQIIPILTPAPEQCAQTIAKLRPSLTPQQIMPAVEIGRTIGGALEILDSPDGAQLSATVKRLPELIAQGGEYELLCALAPHTKKREQLITLLELLRAELAQSLSAQHRSPGDSSWVLTPLQTVRIIDIIDLCRSQAMQNGNIALISSALTARIKSAMSI